MKTVFKTSAGLLLFLAVACGTEHKNSDKIAASEDAAKASDVKQDEKAAPEQNKALEQKEQTSTQAPAVEKSAPAAEKQDQALEEKSVSQAPEQKTATEQKATEQAPEQKTATEQKATEQAPEQKSMEQSATQQAPEQKSIEQSATQQAPENSLDKDPANSSDPAVSTADRDQFISAVNSKLDALDKRIGELRNQANDATRSHVEDLTKGFSDRIASIRADLDAMSGLDDSAFVEKRDILNAAVTQLEADIDAASHAAQ